MQYDVYKLNLERMTQMLRKKLKLPKGEPAIQPALTWLYANSPEMLKSLDFIVQAEEYCWLHSNRVMYYPDSIELCHALNGQTAQLTNSNAFFGGNEVFMLNFPHGVEFGGRPASGCLVASFTHKERKTAFIHPYLKWINFPHMEVDVSPQGFWSITAVYQERGGNPLEYMRISLTSDMAVTIFECKNAEHWAQEVAKVNEFKYLGGARLDGPNSAYQFDLVRFILNFMLYKKALPDRIREGLPGITRKEVETPYTMNRNHYTIRPPRLERPHPLSHYRRWHLRQLMNPCFYRGIHKDKPIGSRIVAVSDTFVGRDIAAKTVQE